MKYPIAIETGNETTAWGVVVPDLPGCFSAGDTLEDAYAMAEESIALWINTALDEGQAIPKAKSLEEHMANPEFKGWAWGVIDVKMEDFATDVERVNISISKRVLNQIDSYVGRGTETRSGFLSRAALEVIYEQNEKHAHCA